MRRQNKKIDKQQTEQQQKKSLTHTALTREFSVFRTLSSSSSSSSTCYIRLILISCWCIACVCDHVAIDHFWKTGTFSIACWSVCLSVCRCVNFFTPISHTLLTLCRPWNFIEFQLCKCSYRLPYKCQSWYRCVVSHVFSIAIHQVNIGCI